MVPCVDDGERTAGDRGDDRDGRQDRARRRRGHDGSDGRGPRSHGRQCARAPVRPQVERHETDQQHADRYDGRERVGGTSRQQRAGGDTHRERGPDAPVPGERDRARRFAVEHLLPDVDAEQQPLAGDPRVQEENAAGHGKLAEDDEEERCA